MNLFRFDVELSVYNCFKLITNSMCLFICKSYSLVTEEVHVCGNNNVFFRLNSLLVPLLENKTRLPEIFGYNILESYIVMFAIL